MPNDKASPKELKVTDKRIFTPEGEIRDEFKQEIRPSEQQPAPQPSPAPEPARETPLAAQPDAVPGPERREESRPRAEGEPVAPPTTRFATFVQQLVVQAYMFLGLLSDRYQPAMKPDPAGAREMIEILVMLQEKTAGNLTAAESEFLTTAIGELKLAYVQRTKNI